MFVNFNNRDRKILAVASILVLIALYFLYDDSLLMSFDTDNSQPELGKIFDLENDVRYKFSKRFAWKSARSKESVRLGDSIFTGKDSKATVSFTDGRSLTIQPNSLVVITNAGDQMKLDLRFGSFGGTLDGCIKVDVKGKQVDVCGNKSKLEINSDGAIQVKEGSVKVADKKIVAAEKEVIPWSKKPEAEFLHSENNRILDIAWSPKKAYSRYRVQFSKDGKFKNSLTQDVTQDTRLETKNYPLKGEYFVRIQAEDANGQNVATTEPIKVKFLDLQAPRIVTPAMNQKFEFPTDSDGEPVEETKVKVTWDYPNKASKYEFELSSQEDFSTVLKRTDSPNKAFETASLAPGKYFVRVRENQKNRPWSRVTPFEVKYLGAKPLEAPKLLTKTIKYLAPSEEKPVAKWESDSRAQKYVIETSTSPDFPTDSTSTFEVNSTAVPLKVVNPGETYFRVSSMTKKGRRSPASEVGILNTQIDRPILKPVAPITTMGKSAEDQGSPVDLKVAWTDLKIAGAYEVQISEDAKFKNPVKFKSTSPESKLTLPKPGNFNWRVRGLNAQGRPITKFSKPDTIKYDLKVPLSQPTLLEPPPNMTLFFQKKTTPYIWLEWKAVRQATSYSVEVALDPDFTKVIYQKTVTSPRHLIKQSLATGKLYWRAQAKGDDGRMSYWSKGREMSVFSGNQKNRMPAGRRK